MASQFKEKNQVNQQEHLVIFEVLPLILQRLNDNPKIFELGQEVCCNIVSHLSIQAFPLVMDIIFSIIKETNRWKIKVGALNVLKTYITRVEKFDRDLLSVSLNDLIPFFTFVIHDTKKEVSETAIETLNMAMKGLTNKDLEPFIENLVNAMVNPDEIEETIQKIGGCICSNC